VTAPNPFATADWPGAMVFRGQGFNYIFILMALATLSVSPRSVWAGGVVAALFWLCAVAAVALFSAPHPELTEAIRAAFAPDMALAGALDPNEMLYNLRIQEVVVILIVSMTLAVSASRFTRLLSQQAGLERERANLARYFSPNVVEELSHNDEPLKQVRTQDVAVLFVDIVGFTQYAADRPSEEVIATLRDFHGRMEREVFAHNGTLDKYLGDGLMATFGTPFAGERDALNALSCARAMIRAVRDWNAERATVGEPPVRVGFGLHYGPAVLGDIGANRLEFAVIGSTVNIASRVEALTRALCVELAVTDELRARAQQEAGGPDPALDGLERRDDQTIRGLDRKLTLWTLSAPPIGKSVAAH
jgi:adenylate cyclase